MEIKIKSERENNLMHVNSSKTTKNITQYKIAKKRIDTEKKALNKIYATGKRKTAVAKVWILDKGSGNVKVNGHSIRDYFKATTHRIIINQPFDILKLYGMFDVKCQVLGSGLSAQAEAIRHGISKCLNKIDENSHKILRDCGLLTRDSRKVERKKYGQPKARKKFQFSKR